MNHLPHILAADKPLTIAGVPAGFLPWLLTDLARASKGRAVYVAADEAAMRSAADTAHYFAPELELLSFPAWDCLPYDRASPSLRTTSERLACLASLQRPKAGSQLLITTINAITQRTLTPFRVRQLSAHLKPGARIDRDQLAALLQANGYVRSDTVADAGEFAIRGSLVDLFPSGETHALRLDFFGDEIESIRSFDPADQRTIGRVEQFTLLPASEALLDEDGIKRFRSRYREAFGATATGDPLYQAVSEGRRLAGMDHWLPLIEERLTTLFDHIGPDCVIVRDSGVTGAAQARFEAIGDYHANRVRAQSSDPGSYRPLAPDALYLSVPEWDTAVADRPIHLTSPFAEPDSASVIDLGVSAARDFAGERARGDNIYEAAATHAAQQAREGRGLIIASYSAGSRDRLTGLLADHGMLGLAPAESWQASPHRTWPSSPNRICSATDSSAGPSARRAPTHFSTSWRCSPPAIGSFTPNMASAAMTA